MKLDLGNNKEVTGRFGKGLTDCIRAKMGEDVSTHIIEGIWVSLNSSLLVEHTSLWQVLRGNR